MIQNYDKISKWNVEFGKIYTFWKIYVVQQWLTQNMWNIGATTSIFNNKLQKILFKNSHMKNEKKTKKHSHSFCKVIPLVPLCVPTPINHLIIPHLSNDIIVECNFKMDLLWTIYLPKLIHLIL
jgi:hypothetical protein